MFLSAHSLQVKFWAITYPDSHTTTVTHPIMTKPETHRKNSAVARDGCIVHGLRLDSKHPDEENLARFSSLSLLAHTHIQWLGASPPKAPSTVLSGAPVGVRPHKVFHWDSEKLHQRVLQIKTGDQLVVNEAKVGLTAADVVNHRDFTFLTERQ